MQLLCQALKVTREKKDALRPQGATNTRNCSRQVVFDKDSGFRSASVGFERTFQDMSQHQPKLLKFRENRFLRLPGRGQSDGLENSASLTGNSRLGTVKKFIISLRRNAAEQKRLNVDGTKTTGPLQSLQAVRNVPCGSKLPAAVTREMERVNHSS